ncbi:hypothetical protein GC425_05605 [Corynebacterium sp. zg254]|nr:hypothetical protein [Corynebacterium sp. zg254]
MDATEAYTTNAIGTAAGIAAGAALGAVAPVIATAVLATAAGMIATYGAKKIWEKHADNSEKGKQ